MQDSCKQVMNVFFRRLKCRDLSQGETTLHVERVDMLAVVDEESANFARTLTVGVVRGVVKSPAAPRLAPGADSTAAMRRGSLSKEGGESCAGAAGAGAVW